MQYKRIKSSQELNHYFVTFPTEVSRPMHNKDFHITNKFDKKMLLGCVKKCEFICHILENEVNHCLSGAQKYLLFK